MSNHYHLLTRPPRGISLKACDSLTGFTHRPSTGAMDVQAMYSKGASNIQR
jgi:hypothetical protein